jgi:hypothetical protein
VVSLASQAEKFLNRRVLSGARSCCEHRALRSHALGCLSAGCEQLLENRRLTAPDARSTPASTHDSDHPACRSSKEAIAFSRGPAGSDPSEARVADAPDQSGIVRDVSRPRREADDSGVASQRSERTDSPRRERPSLDPRVPGHSAGSRTIDAIECHSACSLAQDIRRMIQHSFTSAGTSTDFGRSVQQ